MGRRKKVFCLNLFQRLRTVLPKKETKRIFKNCNLLKKMTHSSITKIGFGSGDSTYPERAHLETVLKPYKYLIVGLDDGLRLRKKQNSILVYSLSFIFTFLVWLYQPPFLALVSFLGICSVILDLINPYLQELIFGEAIEKTWTTAKCVRFREICTELCVYKRNIENLHQWLKTQKVERPNVYLTIISSVLVIVSYVANKFSNLWLCYWLFLAGNLVRALWWEWDQVKGMIQDGTSGSKKKKSQKDQ